MNTNEFDYYLIARDGKFTSPLLMNDDEINSGGIAFLRRLNKVESEETIHLTFNPPIPQKPDMTDYLWLSGGGAVFSKSVFNILKDVDIKDFQLVSAKIKDNKGKEYSDYYIANSYRKFAFLDKDESEVDEIWEDGNWSGIEKMVIDEEEMAKVPLEERLIYRSEENTTYCFYHKSIVDLIMSTNPTGIKFISVEDWEN